MAKQGRPSNLTEEKWEELRQRLLAGESGASLAREYKTSKTAISTRFSKRNETVKTVAHQLVDADQALRRLSVTEQVVALTIADDLKAISRHLSGAARFGAATAHRLAGIAHGQVENVDDAQPEKSLEALQRIGVLMKMANSSAEIGLQLLRVNRDLIEDAPAPADPMEFKHLTAKDLEEIKTRLYAPATK